MVCLPFCFHKHSLFLFLLYNTKNGFNKYPCGQPWFLLSPEILPFLHLCFMFSHQLSILSPRSLWNLSSPHFQGYCLVGIFIMFSMNSCNNLCVDLSTSSLTLLFHFISFFFPDNLSNIQTDLIFSGTRLPCKYIVPLAETNGHDIWSQFLGLIRGR